MKGLNRRSNRLGSMFLLRKSENSPSNLDHLGLEGLHVLQEGLHGLSCVYHGLMGGEERANTSFSLMNLTQGSTNTAHQSIKGPDDFKGQV